MATPSISDLASFKNQQLQINEKITTCLEHLEALMQVVLSTNFFALSKHTMQTYFSVVADIMEYVIQLNQTNLVVLQQR